MFIKLLNKKREAISIQIISNHEPIRLELLNNSLLVVGQAGVGKTTFLKNIVSAHLADNKKVGILCNDLAEYKEFHGSTSLYIVDTKENVKLDLQRFQLFIKTLDVVVVDEADTTIGSGEVLHQLLDLLKGKMKIVSYQTLDSISRSQTYLESVVTRFDEGVFFQTQYGFSSEFILGSEVAATVNELTRGDAVLVSN